MSQPTEETRTEWVDGADPTPEMFEKMPWAESSNADILAAVQQLDKKFDEVITLISNAVAQIQPTIEELKANPLKFLTGKMGGK